MGLFKKKESTPKKLVPFFEEMKRQMEGKKIANEAISYRNLKKYDKAFELLNIALNQYNYLPALTLIGTTMFISGNIEGAIQWFQSQIRKHEQQYDYPIIEFYLNLGNIYNYSLKDYNLAVKTYTEALATHRPKGFPEDDYNTMVSRLYHHLAMAYWNLKDIKLLKEYAFKHLESHPECTDCKMIIDRYKKFGF